MIIAGDEYEAMRDALAEKLGRRPSMGEWAQEGAISERELRKRMQRANSARDLMVAANSAFFLSRLVGVVCTSMERPLCRVLYMFFRLRLHHSTLFPAQRINLYYCARGAVQCDW